MRIARAELAELVLPLVEPFAISGGVVRERASLIVVLHDGEGHVGYGEAPPFATPFYSEETLATARAVLAHVLLPRVVGREFPGPEDLDATLREGVRGNPFARAAVETAAWDLEAARRGTGLAALMGERLGVTPAPTIECGVALGIPAEPRPAALARQVTAAVDAGYRRVKIKIAPGWDLVAVEAAQDALAGSGIPLTVDANGAYRWPDDAAILRQLDDLALLYIEQPFAPDEIIGHVQLAHTLRTPVCLDETLRSALVARQLVEWGGPDVWNVKVHRVGGLSEVCRVCRVAVASRIRLWAGTMPESGIGSQAAIAVAALPYCTYPSDVEPSARWFGARADVIELHMDGSGRMMVPVLGAAGQLDPVRFRSATRTIPFTP